MSEQDKHNLADVSKHTPGKLMITSSFLLVTSEAVVVANTQPVGVGGITTTYDEGAANAERLIKCWNSHEPGGSHDALVEACERALAVHYPNDDLELSPMSHLCFRELTDAIALTKKGA